MSSLMNMLYGVGTDIANSPVRVSERKNSIMDGQEYRSQEAQDARSAARKRSIWTDEAYVDEGQRILDEEATARTEADQRKAAARGSTATSLETRAGRLGPPPSQSIFAPGTDDASVIYNKGYAPGAVTEEPLAPVGAQQQQPAASPDKFSLFADRGGIRPDQGGARADPQQAAQQPAQPPGPPSIFDMGSPFSTAAPAAPAAAPTAAQQAAAYQPDKMSDDFSSQMAVTNPALDKRDRSSWAARKALEAYQQGNVGAGDYYAEMSDGLEAEFEAEEKAAQQGMLDTFLLRLRPTAPEGTEEYIQQAMQRQGVMVQALQAMGPEAIRSIPPHILDMLASDDPTDDDAGLILLGKHLGLELPEWAQDVSVDAHGRTVYKDGLRYSVGDAGRTEEQEMDDRITARGQDITARGQDLTYDAAMTGHQNDADRLQFDKDKFDYENDPANAAPDEDRNMAMSLRGLPDTVVAQEISKESEYIGAVRDNMQKNQRLGGAATRVEAYMDKYGLKKGFTGPDAWSTLVRSTTGRRHADRIAGMMEDMIADMRQQGTGPFTDKDADRAQRRVASAVLEYDQLQSVIDQFQIAEQRSEDYYSFLTGWRNEYKRGSVGDRGDGIAADDVWNAYLNDAPLFLEAEDGTISENKSVMSFADWEKAASAQVFGSVVENALDTEQITPEEHEEILKAFESGKSSKQLLDKYDLDWVGMAFGQ